MYVQNLSNEHPDISELIPWYVNGTIGELDRQRVDAHAAACARCRDELEHERRIFESMAAESSLEYMPAAPFKRLQASLDRLPLEAMPAAAASRPVFPVERAAHQRLSRRSRWPGRVAASIAVLAVALGAVSADHWIHSRLPDAPAAYHTVTTAAPRPRGEVIRAVFSPTITLIELQAILDEAQLRIVAGPTEAGVYSLAASSIRPIDSSLALLRRHVSVRFAESTRPLDAQRAGESP